MVAEGIDMTMARLHLICGNCGCNDEWEWEYQPEAGDDGDGNFEPDAYLWCCNCSTLHSISDNAKQRKVIE